ncbi:MAG: hypothetical protein IJ086_12345 [Clostridium sp.]|nr:hypothetical protein [Clostridium sp.]
MEITNFVTENFLSSFAGTLLAVELVVFTTKSLPLIKKIPTKLYTFILAVIHLIIVQVSSGKADITVEFVYILFINSLIVEVILCGGYDTLMGKFKNIKDTLNQASEDISQINNEISNGTSNGTSINTKGIASNTAAEVEKNANTEVEKTANIANK